MYRLVSEILAKVDATGLEPFHIALIAGLVAVGAILGLISIYGMLAVYAERKVSAFMQNRLGPMEVGPHDDLDVPLGLNRVLKPILHLAAWVIGVPFSLLIRILTLGHVRLPWKLPPGWYGLGQSVADGLKLLAKEDTIPAGADGALFRLAPYVIFTASFTAFAIIPFAPGLAPVALEVGVLVYLAASAVTGVGILTAGYASNNKWSLYGAYRSLAQVLSYEVPLVTCVLVGVMAAGSMDLEEVSASQQGWFFNWFAFHDPFLFVAAVIYFIAAMAECNRTPFDIPEAESELVAGYHTEYSGMRFSLFFLAEYANMLLVSAIAAVLFFGGPNVGIPTFGSEMLAKVLAALGPLVILAKACFGVFLMMWLRWTLPRFRVDQLMEICWKGLVPISLVCLFGAAITTRLAPYTIPLGPVAFSPMRFVGILAVFALVWVYSRAVVSPAPRPAPLGGREEK